MKIRTILLSLLLFHLLVACQAATAEPISTTSSTEFSLVEGQSATIRDAGISVTFLSVSADGRCPFEMECAASGPVSLSLSIRDQNGTESTEILQTFTDVKGLAPEMEFQGIRDRIDVDGYQIKIISVLPYPQNHSFSSGDPDYQISLKVTKH